MDQDETTRMFGLDPALLTQPSMYRWPDSDQGDAKGVVAGVSLAMLMSGDAITNPVRIAEFESIGVGGDAADAAPWLLLLRSVIGDDAIGVQTAPGRENGVAAEPEKGIVGLDLKLAGPVIISSPHGRALAVAAETGLLISLVDEFRISPPASIEAPLRHWLAQGDLDDEWLRTEIERRLEIQSSWATLTAVALFAQYAAPGSKTGMADWSRLIIEGRPVPTMAEPRRWCRELQAEQIQTIQQLARVEADRVDLMLDDIADGISLEASTWQPEWLDACHGRDDLEGVQLLLAETRQPAELIDRLSRLDRNGRVVRSLLPSRPVPGDERTRRSHRLRPGVWWATE